MKNDLFPCITLVVEYNYVSDSYYSWRPTDPYRLFCCIRSNSLCAQIMIATWDNHSDPNIIPFVNLCQLGKLSILVMRVLVFGLEYRLSLD